MRLRNGDRGRRAPRRDGSRWRGRLTVLPVRPTGLVVESAPKLGRERPVGNGAPTVRCIPGDRTAVAGCFREPRAPRHHGLEDRRPEVREHLGATVFQTVVPRSVRLAEAPSHGRPIAGYAPDSRGAIAYRALATELRSRLDHEAGRPHGEHGEAAPPPGSVATWGAASAITVPQSHLPVVPGACVPGGAA